MKIICLLSALFLLLAADPVPGGAPSGQGVLIVQVAGFENNTGNARLLLFDSSGKKHFPSQDDKAYIKKVQPIQANKAVFILEGLPYGDYAISVHHDENADGEVNTNWLGIPKEGLGASNDAKGSFGPPSFDKARVTLDKAEITITINMVN